MNTTKPATPIQTQQPSRKKRPDQLRGYPKDVVEILSEKEIGITNAGNSHYRVHEVEVKMRKGPTRIFYKSVYVSGRKPGIPKIEAVKPHIDTLYLPAR